MHWPPLKLIVGRVTVLHDFHRLTTCRYFRGEDLNLHFGGNEIIDGRHLSLVSAGSLQQRHGAMMGRGS